MAQGPPAVELPAAEPEASALADPDIEVVDFEEDDFALVEDGSLPPPASPADAFERFVATLVNVALSAGAPASVVAALPGMLGAARLDVGALEESLVDALVMARLLARSDTGAVIRSPTLVESAQAWRATLLGEETDLPVTDMLDEWSAHIVATVACVPQQREAIRRDLRARGIAAFGMLDAA